ncbi:putative SAM-dependent methyltransferase [Halanaeroarchaeum sp. HSR-CO]|uniref:class I SAM-dependent methyltransferase n=1 Tax=Halanaeroarchaeum sp. HSR-CO TaxID=2866382 RepID=UPI00217E463B|nr:class I SAM-dependent methyltransferase [Halanaeroarchaeum sp. HSR-CO]UWG48388.1 putative SAM-dependent methyltransferase [Halanaeroarchaeum sp. HSR-CO]
MDHAAIRYLEAKRSIDDRAMADEVLATVRRSLPPDPTILEAGCGTGTMVPRLLELGITDGTYRGVDRDETVIAFARDDRPKELRNGGRQVDVSPRGFRVDDMAVSFVVGDALDAFADVSDADLFVAASFADLVPIPALLDTITTALRPGGLAYLPLTFDGETVFQPDHPADEQVIDAYHQAIDARPGRDARAGRHLLHEFQDSPGELLAVASSDWIVRPRDGVYPTDEAYFLTRILDFVESSLSNASPPVPDLADWLEVRRSQLAASELTYVAHNYDLLYRTAGD